MTRWVPPRSTELQSSFPRIWQPLMRKVRPPITISTRQNTLCLPPGWIVVVVSQIDSDWL